jgi:hypothetical protein
MSGDWSSDGVLFRSDEEAVLLEQGSKQKDLWGINIYFDEPRNSWMRFESMINIKPRQNNNAKSVQSEEIRNQILKIVNNLIE